MSTSCRIHNLTFATELKLKLMLILSAFCTMQFLLPFLPFALPTFLPILCTSFFLPIHFLPAFLSYARVHPTFLPALCTCTSYLPSSPMHVYILPFFQPYARVHSTFLPALCTCTSYLSSRPMHFLLCYLPYALLTFLSSRCTSCLPSCPMHFQLSFLPYALSTFLSGNCTSSQFSFLLNALSLYFPSFV